MSDIDEVYKELDSKHPKLVFINGKTSTGKTTLSNKLSEKYNCAIIELDEVIYALDSPKGINKFIEAYQKRDQVEYIKSFVDAVRLRIQEELKNHEFVIIEGAIVRSETLKEIISNWADSFLFIYLDIKDVDAYVRNLTNRLSASNNDGGNGLPTLFWDKFSPELLEKYYADRQVTPEVENAIRSYAVDSMKESEIRLAKFASKFNHIVKVGV